MTEKTHPFKIGENYLFRTVTMIVTGRLLEVYPTELVVEKAAWVADTGRYAKALSQCTFSEVEIYPQDRQVIVGRQALIDAVIIDTLPDKTE